MEQKSLWESILSRLAPVIGKAHLLTFFKDTVILNVDAGVMTIATPNTMSSNFIRERYEIKILDVAREFVQDLKALVFEVKSSLHDEEHPLKIDMSIFQPMMDKKGVRKIPNKQEVVMEEGMRSKMFNPKYTLNSYIPGNENRLPHAACMAVAAKPGNIYNPLYLYGNVGLGKTHLLQGVGIEILKNHRQKNVVYMTSERFVNEVVDAIGNRHSKSFKEKYRKLDCLIIDDVQFFGNKATCQQEFFHTFNELYDAGKQIVISSDRPPRELDQLEDRLTSRFSMGMVIEIQMPDFETRMAILNAKCMEQEVLIDRDVLEFIAYNVTTSIREMEGILVQAIAESELTHTTPTVRSVADTLKRLNRSFDFQDAGLDVSKRIAVRTPEDMIDVVANYFKLPKSELVSEVRKKEVMMPRQVCMYLIREILSRSYESIGDSFGGRNHTTVLHACHKIAEELKQNEKLTRDINALKREIGA